MQKLKTITEISKITRKLQKNGKSVGLITGCFDILHVGHIDLFKFAKKYVDILIVALESDKTIKLNKGINRPIYKISDRISILNEFKNIDYILKINSSIVYESPKAKDFYQEIYRKISPTYIITTPVADKSWQRKNSDVKEIGIKLLKFTQKRSYSSSTTINKLLKNNI